MAVDPGHSVGRGGLEGPSVTAAEALEAARRAGVRVRVDGGDLLLAARSRPQQGILDYLSRHKAGIIALLCSTAEDRQASFEERAAIIEFDGGFSRAEAEVMAMAEIVASRPKS